MAEGINPHCFVQPASGFGEPQCPASAWKPGAAAAVAAAYAQHKVVVWLKSRHPDLSEREIGDRIGLTKDRADRLLSGKQRFSLEDLFGAAISESTELLAALSDEELFPPSLMLDPVSLDRGELVLIRRTWAPLVVKAVVELVQTEEALGRGHLMTCADLRATAARVLTDTGIESALIEYRGIAVDWSLRDGDERRRSTLAVLLVSAQRVREPRYRSIEVARVLSALYGTAARDVHHRHVLVVADDFGWTLIEEHAPGLRSQPHATLRFQDALEAGVRHRLVNEHHLDLQTVVLGRRSEGSWMGAVLELAKPG